MGQKISKEKVVQDFRLDRYLGLWHEIARYPFLFEEGCNEVTAEYKKKADTSDEIIVINTCLGNKKKESIGRAVLKYPGEEIGQLSVSFFPWIWSDYNIMAIQDGPDKYQMSIVATDMDNTGKYKNLWILSRTKTLSLSQRSELMMILKDLNVEMDKLIWNKK